MEKKEELLRLVDSLSYENKLEIANYIISSLRKFKEGEILIPVSIFTNKLGSLESIVKYLKENLKLSNIKIANLLNRDNKVIWGIYNKAKAKVSKKLDDSNKHFLIPLSIFSDKKLSILENLVSYLKDNYELRYSEIAKLIHRDERTVWVVYDKARKKVKK